MLVTVAVGVCVGVNVTVFVGVAVGVLVGVAVGVLVGVAVGSDPTQVNPELGLLSVVSVVESIWAESICPIADKL